MSVVDFTQKSGSAEAVLNKALMEADAASDAITYKVYVLFPLSSRSDAERMEASIPGLGDAYDLAGEDGDNWKGALSVKPSDSLRVVVTAKEAVGGRQGCVLAGATIIQGTADVVEVKATLSKKARTVLARLVFRGQSSAMAAGLADNLGRSVGFAFERLQGVLDFLPAAKTPGIRVGMIVAATLPDGSQVQGRVTEVEGDEVSFIEAGTEYGVPAKAVLTAFAFSDDADTQAALADYAERCGRRGVPVSWTALIAVMAAGMGLGDGEPLGHGAKVCLEDVEAAISRVVPPATSAQEPDPSQEGGEVVAFAPAAEAPKGRRPKALARA